MRQYVQTITVKIHTIPETSILLEVRRSPTLSAFFAIVVPAPKRAPAHAGTPSNRISAVEIGRYAGTVRSNQAGRRNNQKNLS